MTAFSLLLYILGCSAIVIGFSGSILPVLPGPPLIWLGALLWAWGNGFEKVGWPTLIVLGVLAVGALSTIPVIGTLIGALAGAVAGMWVIEFYVRQDSRAATNAVRAYLSGATLSAVTQFVIASLMMSIFVWQAFF